MKPKTQELARISAALPNDDAKTFRVTVRLSQEFLSILDEFKVGDEYTKTVILDAVNENGDSSPLASERRKVKRFLLEEINTDTHFLFSRHVEENKGWVYHVNGCSWVEEDVKRLRRTIEKVLKVKSVLSTTTISAVLTSNSTSTVSDSDGGEL